MSFSHQTGTTPNEFLFAGEQYDSNLHLYYNRARYLNVSTGRFWSMDVFEGDPESPLSLHKYLYVEDDSVDALDPSGNQIDDLAASFAVNATLSSISTVVLNSPLGRSAESAVASWLIPPDVVQGLKYAEPDAIEVGIYGQVNLNLRNPIFGATGYGGFELLGSPKTGKAALYSFAGGGASFGPTASGGALGGNVGLVFHSPTSTDYTGPFTEFTIPAGALGSATLQRIEGEMVTVNVAGFEGGIPATYNGLLILLNTVPLGTLSASKAVTIFWGHSEHGLVFGASFGVTASGASGEAAPNWALTRSYYWQLAPSQSVHVPFE